MKENIKTEIIEQIVKAALEKQGRPQRKMTLKLAKILMQKVEEKAIEWGMKIVVAVSDSSGRPIAVHVMDGAYMGSYDVAVNKTYTAIAFQMSTKDLGKLAAPGESLYGIQFTNEGKIVIFGGGEPLKSGEEIIGAVGISGGSAVQDTQLAEFARKVFEEEILCL